MVAFLKPKSDGSGCCACDKSPEPCSCCDLQSSDSYFETHGSEECPNVGDPCPSGDGTPSCAGSVIGPIKLYSDEFPTKCLDTKAAKAAIVYTADNFGLAIGQSGQVGCTSTSTTVCESCAETGVITPFVENTSPGKSKMYIKAYAKNAPHGGPYTLFVSANFYLE